MKNSFIICIVWVAVIVGIISFGATVFFIDNASKQQQVKNNKEIKIQEDAYVTNESSIRMNYLTNVQTSESNKEQDKNKTNNTNPGKDIINTQDNIKNIEINEEISDEDIDIVYDNGEALESMNKNINSFIRPVKGDVLNPFSVNELVYSKTLKEWNIHKGTDYEAQLGTEVYSVDDGKISEMKFDSEYGNSLVIEHENGYQSKYSNVTVLDALKVGDIVKQAQLIGYVAESYGFEAGEETHLHFELKKDGKYISI